MISCSIMLSLIERPSQPKWVCMMKTSLPRRLSLNRQRISPLANWTSPGSPSWMPRWLGDLFGERRMGAARVEGHALGGELLHRARFVAEGVAVREPASLAGSSTLSSVSARRHPKCRTHRSVRRQRRRTPDRRWAYGPTTAWAPILAPTATVYSMVAPASTVVSVRRLPDRSRSRRRSWSCRAASCPAAG